MHQILVIGAGKISSLIAFMLAHSKDYFVYLADIQAQHTYANKLKDAPNFKYVQLDAKDTQAITAFT